MSARPDLTVTVVSWNTRDLLRACLNSIAAGAGEVKIEVHVVDNDSRDGSAEMVREEFPGIRLIANEENLGFARANNQSWREASGRYWLLLNSDAEPRPGALEALVRFMDAHPRAGLSTARVVGLDGEPQHCAQPPISLWRPVFEALRLHKLLPAHLRGRVMLGPYFSYAEDALVGWTWGTALIARRDAVERVGALSEKFFMYGEDLEWSLRMRHRGWEIWFCAEAEVLHHGGQSSMQRWDDAGKQRVILDNIYRAIAMHRDRVYVCLLHIFTLNALRIEWCFRVLRGRDRADLRSLIQYHRQAVSRCLCS